MHATGNEIVWDLREQERDFVTVERRKLLCSCGAELLAYSRRASTAIRCPSCGGSPELELVAEDLSLEMDPYDEEGPDVQVYVISQAVVER
jgi:hypothetical protein